MELRSRLSNAGMLLLGQAVGCTFSCSSEAKDAAVPRPRGSRANSVFPLLFSTVTQARRFIGNRAGDEGKETFAKSFAQASRRPPSTRTTAGAAAAAAVISCGGREESSLKEIMNSGGGEVICMKMTRAERGARRRRRPSWIPDRRRIRGAARDSSSSLET